MLTFTVDDLRTAERLERVLQQIKMDLTSAADSIAKVNAQVQKSASVPVPASQVLVVSFHSQAASAMVDQTFFIADRSYLVTGIQYVHSTAETTAANLRIQVTRDTLLDAPGAGSNLLQNNSGNGFDGKATANTVQIGLLFPNIQLASGDRLSADFEAAATELVGVTITVALKPV